MAAVTFQLDSAYGYVILVAMLSVFELMWMAIQVGVARRKYGVLYPTMYAVESENKNAHFFNCVQRAHQNTLESYPQFLVFLFVGGVQHPIASTVFGLIYLVARIFYFQGYSTKGPKGRFQGGWWYIALLGQMGCCISMAWRLLASAQPSA